jgi:diguanylate cyclase
LPVNKKLLIANIAITAITLLFLFLNINTLWVDLLLSVLILSFLVPSYFTFNHIKKLLEKEKGWKTHFQKLEKQYNHLENVASKAKYKELQYHSLFDDMGVLAFTIDLIENKWVISNQLEENFGENIAGFQLGISFIEETVHAEDKKSFLKKKNQWLSGAPNPLFLEFRTVSANGKIHWNELRTKPIVNSSGTVEKINGIIIDVTNRKEKEENLSQMAFYDALTELPNRMMLKTHLRKVLSRAKRKDHEVIILFLDLDGFKDVNDSLGHDIGDILLKDVADRLIACVREEDMVSRIGGDEFIIVFEETGKEEVALIAGRIIQMVSNPYFISDHEVKVTPSIGISIYPEHGDNLDSVVTHADTAMYVAKNKGKSQYQFYSPELEDYENPDETLISKFLKLFQK